MFYLARIGDTVSHDLLGPSGAIGPPVAGPAVTVVIEYMPAAFAGCSVVCGGLTAAGPAHPPAPAPGIILGGSTTLLIQGAPAARWIAPDLCTCGALLGDPKLLGTRTVVVGS